MNSISLVVEGVVPHILHMADCNDFNGTFLDNWGDVNSLTSGIVGVLVGVGIYNHQRNQKEIPNSKDGLKCNQSFNKRSISFCM